jgi:hypothetical protein
VNKPVVALVVTVVGGVIVALVVALLHIGSPSGSSQGGSSSARSSGAASSTGTAIPAGSVSSPVTSQSSVPNGTQLGAYTFKLRQAHGTPLGATKPTLSQFIDLGPGDILYDGNITPGNGDQLLELPGGSTPTYQACMNNTLIENSAPATAETAFCVVETGRIAGVTVTSHTHISMRSSGIPVLVNSMSSY